VIDADRIDQGSEELAQVRDDRLFGARWGVQGRQLCQVASQGIEQVSVLLHENLLRRWMRKRDKSLALAANTLCIFAMYCTTKSGRGIPPYRLHKVVGTEVAETGWSAITYTPD
jgi:hypothetical protein